MEPHRHTQAPSRTGRTLPRSIEGSARPSIAPQDGPGPGPWTSDHPVNDHLCPTLVFGGYDRTTVAGEERQARDSWKAEGLRRFWCDCRGIAAIEFAFMAPLLIMIFAGIVQFGALFFVQGSMGFAAREAARSCAIGAVETQTEAEALVASKLTSWSINFVPTASFPDPNDPNDTDCTVNITAPLSEAAIVDILGIFDSGTLKASATMRKDG